MGQGSRKAPGLTKLTHGTRFSYLLEARHMKTLLIYHEGARLEEEVMLRWLASFLDLVGLIVLQESKDRKWKRLRREIKRVGFLRFADVVAFRVFYRLFFDGTMIGGRVSSRASWAITSVRRRSIRPCFEPIPRIAMRRWSSYTASSPT